MKYEVAVIYKGQSNFIVEAADEEQAVELAEYKFMEGDDPDRLGNEWETVIDTIAVMELPDEATVLANRKRAQVIEEAERESRR